MTNLDVAETLKKLKKDSPLLGSDFSIGKFIPWQGIVFAFLGYNPSLQEDFKKASQWLIENESSFRYGLWEEPAAAAKANGISACISQAINELSMPEKPPILTDKENWVWFFSHCSYEVRWKACVWLAGAFLAIFAVGFTAGRINLFKQIYEVWTAKPKAEATQPPVTPEKTTNAKVPITTDAQKKKPDSTSGKQ